MWKWIVLLCFILCGCSQRPPIIITSEQRFQMEVQKKIYEYKVEKEALSKILDEEAK